MNKVYGIQYLRALAVLGVVIYHAANKTGYHFAIGRLGVDIFFVMSGFIIWSIAQSGKPVTPLRFLLSRIKRVVPPYWLATVVMIAGAFAGLFPNLQLTPEHTAASLLFVPAISPSNGEIWPVLVQGWTLNYEMFFYLVFAATLFIPAKIRLEAIALLFAGLVAVGAQMQPSDPILKTFTSPLLLEFVIGMVLAKLYLKNILVPKVIAGALLVLVVGTGIYCEFARIILNDYSAGLLATVAVLAVLSFEKMLARQPITPVRYMGDASYAIYLWHTLAISVVAKIGTMLALPSILIFTGAIVSGLILGVMAYEAFEQRLLRLRLKVPPAR